MNTEMDIDLRIQQLKQARETIRSSHFGIDTEVDRLMQAVTTWYLLNSTQQRPRVVGLWGMTGTGKSSLVRALVDALGLGDRTFWLDAGESHLHNWLDRHLELIMDHHDGGETVVVIDEFQRARTVKGGDDLGESVELRRLWEFMDSGRAVVMPWRNKLEDLQDLHRDLSEAIARGCEIRNGRVTAGVEVFLEMMVDRLDTIGRKERWALPRSTWSWAREPGRESTLGFKQRLEHMDGAAILAMLKSQIDAVRSPRILDGRRTLVIVLGNLDGLYTVGSEPVAELEPDVLLARHKQMNLAGVQQALLELFRIEQVGRLGSDHVIFPPIGASTVKRLVGAEAERIATSASAALGTTITVRETLLDRIQREASIAVLGARPVIEAVHQVLPALIAEALSRTTLEAPHSIVLDTCGRKALALCDSLHGNDRVSLNWPLHRQAPGGKEKVHRNIAAHEAGHLICGVSLLGQTPLQVCARTSHERIGGFTIWANDTEHLTRNRIVPRIASALGGWAAERLLFGADRVTAGNDDDLRKASQLALGMLKNHGFGKDRLHHAEYPEAFGTGFRMGLAVVEEQAARLVAEGEQLALQTLTANRRRLEAITGLLVQYGSLSGKMLRSALELPNDPPVEVAKTPALTVCS
ncbi:MAG: hypothetical protein IT228_01520 [Flavobacteriales bacterium]|nr:ATP-dependent zinc metalloprotease FtsH [Flavobacteriales bacterium]MCC6575993.1 hypothetical protein [Flavobacteriales bacterium]NUQ13929.1 hypothetical protein [Flavobacteriales bacterium]